MTKYNERSYAAMKKRVLTAPHYFALLEVHAQSEVVAISSARAGLARVFHPDRNGDPKASELMAKINVAADVLMDDKLRTRYLASLSQAPCTVCGGRGAKVKQVGFTKTETTICLVCRGSGRAT